VGGSLHLANAAWIWIPPILVAAAGAFLFMDNLASARSNFADQVVVTKNRHTWIMAVLYVATFGSFVGYSAAFPLLLKTQFPEFTANLAFVGPLVGSIARPVGGWLADRLGGARVSLWNFAVMGLCTAGAISALAAHDLHLFLALFVLLFVTTGIGNGSTFRMIPVIFRAERLRTAQGRGDAARAEALVAARRESAAVLGITSAIGALGGFLIPRAFGASIKATGSATTALGVFLGFYVLCLGITWWCYLRRSPVEQGEGALAAANA
jgi:NNP family nitrate/nitrite transporter-like MFS transporter